MEDEKEIRPNCEQESFSEMVKEFDLKRYSSNSAVEGYILEITDDKVIIDIGQKTEGFLNREEILDWNNQPRFKKGDTIRVIPKYFDKKEGYIIVSKKDLDLQEGWHSVSRAYNSGNPMRGRIMRQTPDGKGYLVDMGVEMFLPISQVDLHKVKKPHSELGREYDFKIIRLNPRDKSGVVSRRLLLEEERKQKIDSLLGKLKVGDRVKGPITSIISYGLFVDIDGVEGFLHKENMSHGRISSPKEKFRKGDELEVQVLAIDCEKGKVSLGLKQLQEDPWLTMAERYPLGKRVMGKITKIVSFGAFVEIEDGVEALLHVKDLTWEGRPNTVEEYVEVGEETLFQIVEVDQENRRLKVGLKQLELRPEEKYLQDHPVNSIVRGKVKKILQYKVFVELAENVEGAVRISDMSYFRIESPDELVNEGDEVSALIISDELDRNDKVQLSLKELADEEWREFAASSRSNDIIKVKVKKASERGITVEVSKNIEGFIRLSEIDEERVAPEDVEKRYLPGNELEAAVQRIDLERKRVYLSLKGVERLRESEEVQKYQKDSSQSITTIGDLLQSKINEES